MKVVIFSKEKQLVFDTEKQPIMLVFNSDEDLQQHLENMSAMPAKAGEKRGYLISPDHIKFNDEQMEQIGINLQNGY